MTFHLCLFLLLLYMSSVLALLYVYASILLVVFFVFYYVLCIVGLHFVFVFALVYCAASWRNKVDIYDRHLYSVRQCTPCPKKHVTTFSTITLTISVRLQ